MSLSSDVLLKEKKSTAMPDMRFSMLFGTLKVFNTSRIFIHIYINVQLRKNFQLIPRLNVGQFIQLRVQCPFIQVWYIWTRSLILICFLKNISWFDFIQKRIKPKFLNLKYNANNCRLNTPSGMLHVTN